MQKRQSKSSGDLYNEAMEVQALLEKVDKAYDEMLHKLHHRLEVGARMAKVLKSAGDDLDMLYQTGKMLRKKVVKLTKQGDKQAKKEKKNGRH